MKCLGVTMQRNLSWDLHVDNLVKKPARCTGMLCNVLFLILLNLGILVYTTLFLSNLSYCHLVWSTTWSNTERLHKIRKKKPSVSLQMLHFRLILSLSSSLILTPVHGLYNLLLNKRYVRKLKNNDTFFDDLANLQPKSNYY